MAEQTGGTGTEKSGGSNLLKIFLVILALAIIGLVIWLVSTTSDLKELRTEKQQQKEQFMAELDSLMAEHRQVKEEYSELADTLLVKDSIITQRAEEIRDLLNYKWEYYKINKKLERLQGIAQGYVRQMDSLYKENKNLKEENVQIKKQYQDQIAKTDELQKQQEKLTEKVLQAEILQTYNLTAEPIQMRWGGSKEKVTDKAKRVDKIKICFTLSENPILPEGTKELYVRIAQPDKLILTPSRGDNYSFMYNGEKIQYSIMKEVEYTGNAIDLCLYWRKVNEDQEMMEGTYHVEIFHQDNVIGSTTFTLE